MPQSRVSQEGSGPLDPFWFPDSIQGDRHPADSRHLSGSHFWKSLHLTQHRDSSCQTAGLKGNFSTKRLLKTVKQNPPTFPWPLAIVSPTCRCVIPVLLSSCLGRKTQQTLLSGLFTEKQHRKRAS